MVAIPIRVITTLWLRNRTFRFIAAMAMQLREVLLPQVMGHDHAEKTQIAASIVAESEHEIGHESFRQILETTITHCPNINNLRVDPGDNSLSVADLVRLIQVYPKGLQFFIIAMPKTDQDQILKAILRTSRSTLDSFYLDFGAFTHVAIPEASIHHLSSENAPN
ncbi:hypothetical protein KI688_000571 [Linnemannia hyalina]|uniref:Uncharacterized protein n=1 Tax=Linnemannia hyalina TaxID=64524 RepID=A0A9P7Y6D9_9FUNG|nr:hypothetical protein KI688_000571 [Linnemannia hyalina]